MNGAFIRVADGDRKLNTHEIHLLHANRGQPLDDQQPIHEAIAEYPGTGIPAMIQSLRLAEMSPPRFEDRVSTFRVTFPRESLVDTDILASLSELGRPVSTSGSGDSGSAAPSNRPVRIRRTPT